MLMREENKYKTLNSICPYFTMFPLDFPLKILHQRAMRGQWVLDPFCGRGTTNFAARLTGLNSLGIDSSPVAEAITASKLVITSAEDILVEAQHILNRQNARYIPSGEFWEWAYHPQVLESLCRFREAFLENCSTASRIALRGIILGALHGPKQKTFPSYFSNQNPRTYAPKPAYSIKYWKERELLPCPVDVLGVIERRAKRYYEVLPDITGIVRLADSRKAESMKLADSNIMFNWVITSPPYYGMRTYIPDQWLRNWFVGGSESVDYSAQHQVMHSSPKNFIDDLQRVWINTANVCADNANMIIRFGGISNRNVNYSDLIKNSLKNSGWRITTIKKAGLSTKGKRQADTFLRSKSIPMPEYDVWATLK